MNISQELIDAVFEAAKAVDHLDGGKRAYLLHQHAIALTELQARGPQEQAKKPWDKSLEVRDANGVLTHIRHTKCGELVEIDNAGLARHLETCTLDVGLDEVDEAVAEFIADQQRPAARGPQETLRCRTCGAWVSDAGLKAHYDVHRNQRG